MAPLVLQNQVDFDKAAGPVFQISGRVLKVPPVFQLKGELRLEGDSFSLKAFMKLSAFTHSSEPGAVSIKKEVTGSPNRVTF